VDVITGIIKANISSRIALSVVSQVDSRTIIDSAGAENLLGQGDMLFLPLEYSKPVRIQGCYVSDEEIEKVVKTLKENAVIEYNEEVLEAIEREAAKEKGTAASNSSGMDDKDSMLDAAIELVVEAGQASTSFLQRRLKLGFSRAGRIMDEMEAMGIIGPPDGSKPRVVNLTMQQLRESQRKFDEIEG
jgi:S-DNA-T family DNA segregation ATPase FtsK/SpoIIIE